MGPDLALQNMHPNTMGKEEWLLTARWESSATLNHETLFMRKNEKKTSKLAGTRLPPLLRQTATPPQNLTQMLYFAHSPAFQLENMEQGKGPSPHDTCGPRVLIHGSLSNSSLPHPQERS